MLLGQEVAAEIHRQARKAEVQLRIWPQSRGELFGFGGVDVIARRNQLKILIQKDRDGVRQRKLSSGRRSLRQRTREGIARL